MTVFLKEIEFAFTNHQVKKLVVVRQKKVKKSKSYIKVSSKTYRKVKKGYSTESSGSSRSKEVKKKGIGLYVKANYIVTPMASSTYNIMVYNTPYDGETVETLWTNDGAGGTSFVGFGGRSRLLSNGCLFSCGRQI